MKTNTYPRYLIPTRTNITLAALILVGVLILTMAKDLVLTGNPPDPVFYATVSVVSGILYKYVSDQ